MNERESLLVGGYLLSVTVSLPGTSMQNVSCVVNGVTLGPRYHQRACVSFRWGVGG